MKVLTQPRTHVRKQLKAFIAKVQGDKSLQEQLKAEGDDVVAIAKSAGFSISTEDLNTYRENLSDEELEGVAGGTLLPVTYSGGGSGGLWGLYCSSTLGCPI